MARGRLRFPTAADACPKPDEEIADALAGFGLVMEADEDEDEPVEDEFFLWPENVPPFELWLSVQTQWVIGMNGPAGLNYAGVHACMSLQGVKKKKQAGYFAAIQSMESAMLDELSQAR